MDQWVTLLIQVPLVGVFIWYSVRMAEISNSNSKAFLDSIQKRDESYLKALNNISDAINAHETLTADRLIKMAVERDRQDRRERGDA